MYFPAAFKGLLDFSYQRRGLEVPVFFLVYLIGTIMAGAVVGMIIASIFHSNAIRADWKVDYITASLLMTTISYFMIQQKGLAQNLKILWILPILAGLLAIWPGLGVALCIPTILSTRPKSTPFTPPPLNKAPLPKSENSIMTAPDNSLNNKN